MQYAFGDQQYYFSLTKMDKQWNFEKLKSNIGVFTKYLFNVFPCRSLSAFVNFLDQSTVLFVLQKM